MGGRLGATTYPVRSRTREALSVLHCNARENGMSKTAQRHAWFVKRLAAPTTGKGATVSGPTGSTQVVLAGPFKTLLAAEDAAERLVADGITDTLYCECNPVT
jgi:hypothetical protein